MSDLLERIAGPEAVASGASTLFTGIAAHTYTIRHMTLTNNTGSPVTVKLGIGGVADANLILPSSVIEAGGMAEFSGILVLSGTETLHASTSGTGLTFTMSGLDQS